MAHPASLHTQPATVGPVVVLDQSYRNFHAKGLDYLCLKRSDDHTVKVYFFDGDADLSALPEIVMPHDHRYNFDTVCISGEVANKEFSRCAPFAGATRHEEFAWDTPLLGGAGFSHVGEAWLTEANVCDYRAGDRWSSGASVIHTLQIRRPGTIIRLDQFGDVVPVGKPTSTFRRADTRGDIAPPDVAGLYDRMTADYAAARLRQYAEACRARTAVEGPSVGTGGEAEREPKPSESNGGEGA